MFVLIAAELAISLPIGTAWPEDKPAAIVRTPDWSDYSIYPKNAQKLEQEGKVRAQIRIGSDGVPTACRIVETSRFQELDNGTCNLMMTMRFAPARNASGSPTESSFSRRVVWILASPREFGSSRLITQMEIKQGEVQDCLVVEGNGPYLAFWSALACSMYTDVRYFFGSRALDHLSATIETRLDARDGAAFLDQPWRTGEPISSEKVTFTINSQGDPSDCRATQRSGLGERDLNNLSPCGRLLSALWIKDRPRGTPQQSGIFETRVVLRDRSN